MQLCGSGTDKKKKYRSSHLKKSWRAGFWTGFVCVFLLYTESCLPSMHGTPNTVAVFAISNYGIPWPQLTGPGRKHRKLPNARKAVENTAIAPNCYQTKNCLYWRKKTVENTAIVPNCYQTENCLCWRKKAVQNTQQLCPTVTKRKIVWADAKKQ